HEGHRKCGRPAHGGGDGNARHLLDSRDHLAPLRSRGSHTLSACHKWRCWCRGRIVKHAYRLYRTRARSEEHTSELQSRFDLVCRLLLEKKNQTYTIVIASKHIPYNA